MLPANLDYDILLTLEILTHMHFFFEGISTYLFTYFPKGSLYYFYL